MRTLQKEVRHNFGSGSEKPPRLLCAQSKWSISTLLDTINIKLPNPITFENFVTLYFVYDGAVRCLPAAEMDNHLLSAIRNC